MAGAANLIRKNSSVIAYGAIFLVIFLWNIYTPFVADDFDYHFNFATGERMTGLSQLIPSMKTHFLLYNGRILPHTIVQILLMLPNIIFKIMNSVLFCGLIYIMQKIAELSGAEKIKRYVKAAPICIFMAIAYFTPAFGQVFLWEDGAINYMWADIITLLALFPIIQYWSKGKSFVEDDVVWRGRLKKTAFIVLSVMAGTWAENTSTTLIGMTVLLLLGIVVVQKKKMPLVYIMALVFQMIGLLLLFISPAERNKGSANYSGQLMVADGVYWKNMKWIVIAFIVLLVCSCYKKHWKAVTLSVILFAGGLASNYVMMFATYYSERSQSLCVILSLLACLTLGEALSKTQYEPLYLSAVSIVCFVSFFSIVLGSIEIVDYYHRVKDREKEIYFQIENGEQDIKVPVLFSNSKYCAGYDTSDLTDDPNFWTNKSKAKYYEVSTMTGLY